MVEQIEGYSPTPDPEKAKAKVFFDKAGSIAATGNFEYAIELYMQGLERHPEDVDAHQNLRDVALRRKASGGKAMGMFEKMKLRSSKDDKVNMLSAEKLLSYDPGNVDHMTALLQSAHRAGAYQTVMWIGPILQKANADSPRPSYDKFIILKDIYKSLFEWKLATDACHHAAAMKPDDMDLQNELKNLGAQQTMQAGGYGTGGSFSTSVKDKDAQQRLMEQDKGVLSEDLLARNIREAEEQLAADPTEPGKVMKLVEALVKTESLEHENRAIEILEETYKRTKQFRFRLNVGQIKMRQLSRMERSMRTEVARAPQDEDLKKSYVEFIKEKAEEELAEFKLASEAYPTELGYKYQIALRLFDLGRYDEAIPRFQEAVQEPKTRADATVYLGRAFLEAGFADEAVDTLHTAIEAYPIRGDVKSKEMHYWYGRSLEAKGDTAPAIKNYSQVAQWDFNYKDVQTRIKALRAAAAK